MTTLAVDVDGILANWNRGFLRHYNLTFFHSASEDGVVNDECLEPTSWNFEKELPRDKFQHAIETFYERDRFYERLSAYVANCDSLAEFIGKRPEVNIVYLTARPSPSKGPSALVQTNRWLRAQNLMTDSTALDVVDNWVEKSLIAKARRIDAIIDDHTETVEMLRGFGFNATLLSRPWNKDADLPRVDTLKMFLDSIK